MFFLVFYEKEREKRMDVSENSGTPKSSILIGCSIINHPFWGTPIFGNTHIHGRHIATTPGPDAGPLSCVVHNAAVTGEASFSPRMVFWAFKNDGGFLKEHVPNIAWNMGPIFF